MIGADCLCGRGPAIGTIASTGGRVWFRAFHDGPVAYHEHNAADWACADCVADLAAAAAGLLRPARPADNCEHPEFPEGAIWAVVQDAGHLDCGGWSYGTPAQPWVVRCNCGIAIDLRDTPSRDTGGPKENES